jgi:hypothetical protein
VLENTAELGFVQHFLHIFGNFRKKNSSSDGAEKKSAPSDVFRFAPKLDSEV